MKRRFSGLFLAAGLLAAGGFLRADTADPALFKPAVLENNIAYLRVGQVDKDLAAEISAAQHASATTNKIIGTVLDLRFADGNDLAAAKATASLLAAEKLPLAILINGQTSGAATALAVALREARAGLVFGGAPNGLKPDIAIIVGMEAERAYLKDPYAETASGGTNAAAATNFSSPFVDHTSEADLVRAKIKDGDQDEDSQPPRPVEPQKPFIHDPVLARAVDLIEALAILRPASR